MITFIFIIGYDENEDCVNAEDETYLQALVLLHYYIISFIV